MQLQKATKKKVKARIGISGASGFGKTYSALLLAYGFTGDWSKIAVIDTENGSADLYSDLGEYQTLSLEPPYSPERYIEAIETCENAGIEVCIIDSITHEWSGEGGCLAILDSLGGKFQDWAKITPRHNKFVQKILSCNMHTITTTRRKQDYQMQEGQNGKKEVKKAGTKEEQRDGYEYELMLNFEIFNEKHMCKASKDRTGLFADKPDFVITSDTGKTIYDWCNTGVDEKDMAMKEMEGCPDGDRNCIKQIWNKYPQLQKDQDFYNLTQNKAIKTKDNHGTTEDSK